MHACISISLRIRSLAWSPDPQGCTRVCLRNRALKERHWGKIFAVIDKQIPRDESFTLQVLLDARVQDWKDDIAQISTEATQELALEELLNKVQNKWADVEFQALPYKEVKDTYILGGIEDVQVQGPRPYGGRRRGLGAAYP